jgi:hypothetical protein
MPMVGQGSVPNHTFRFSHGFFFLIGLTIRLTCQDEAPRNPDRVQPGVSQRFVLTRAVGSALCEQDVFAIFSVIFENVDSIFQDRARIPYLSGALSPVPL